ncbi:hypothetical protein PI87_25660 [Ralstonia sp. A12]|nr:hypothetical protein PI87_25660 [Ralstonia sp. A12]
MLTLVAEIMLLLGAPYEVAREAARTGQLRVAGRQLVLTCSGDETTLLIGAPLSREWATPAARRALLLANAPLLLTAGVAVAAGHAGLQLISRWPLAPRRPAALARWLRSFASLATDIESKRHGALSPIPTVAQ